MIFNKSWGDNLFYICTKSILEEFIILTGKPKNWNYNKSRGKNLSPCRREWFIKQDTNTAVIFFKVWSTLLDKIGISAHQKTSLGKWKDKSSIGKRYLQHIINKGCYKEHTKNSKAIKNPVEKKAKYTKKSFTKGQD